VLRAIGRAWASQHRMKRGEVATIAGLAATVVGTDPKTDIALLKVEPDA